MNHLYLCLHSVRQLFIKKNRNNCDLFSDPSCCTFTCNVAFYTVVNCSFLRLAMQMTPLARIKEDSKIFHALLLTSYDLYSCDVITDIVL